MSVQFRVQILPNVRTGSLFARHDDRVGEGMCEVAWESLRLCFRALESGYAQMWGKKKRGWFYLWGYMGPELNN